jgi:hypothetical protein
VKPADLVLGPRAAQVPISNPSGDDVASDTESEAAGSRPSLMAPTAQVHLESCAKFHVLRRRSHEGSRTLRGLVMIASLNCSCS